MGKWDTYIKKKKKWKNVWEANFSSVTRFRKKLNER